MQHSQQSFILKCWYFLIGGVTNAWTCWVPCRQSTSEANTVCRSFTSTKTSLVLISLWMPFTLEREPPRWWRMVPSVFPSAHCIFFVAIQHCGACEFLFWHNIWRWCVTVGLDRCWPVRLNSLFHSCSLTDVLNKRKPPPFESAGHSFDVIAVTKDGSLGSQIRYEIKATPTDCAFGFPLLEVGFLQVTY